MQIETIVAFAGLCIYTIAVWALGWHYGARSFRDRNKRFLKIMKEYNDNRNPKSQWFKGYTEGITSTLEALERFLGQFKVDDNGSS